MVKSDINKAKWQVWDKHWIYTNELIRNQVEYEVVDQVQKQVSNQVWTQVWCQIWDDLKW